MKNPGPLELIPSAPRVVWSPSDWLVFKQRARRVSCLRCILVGEVVNQSADERILTGGKVDLAKLQPIVFDAAGVCYRAVGEVVGGAWSAGKKFSEI